ncbi:MAG: hypothetical protein PHW63_10755, partial [Alphaproteobacteria bacterium]|nr:hypothetical protein [Alphaproteobacteria bacterium]
KFKSILSRFMVIATLSVSLATATLFWQSQTAKAVDLECTFSTTEGTNSWHVAANWSCGQVPDLNSNVTITSTVNVFSSAVAKQVNLNAGSNLKAWGNTIQVYGDWWANEGSTFTYGTSTVEFVGTAVGQMINGWVPTDEFYNLTINKSGAGTVNSWNPVTVYGVTHVASGTWTIGDFYATNFSGAVTVDAAGRLTTQAGDADVTFGSTLTNNGNLHLSGLVTVQDDVLNDADGLFTVSSTRLTGVTLRGDLENRGTTNVDGKIRLWQNLTNTGVFAGQGFNGRLIVGQEWDVYIDGVNFTYMDVISPGAKVFLRNSGATIEELTVTNGTLYADGVDLTAYSTYIDVGATVTSTSGTLNLGIATSDGNIGSQTGDIIFDELTMSSLTGGVLDIGTGTATNTLAISGDGTINLGTGRLALVGTLDVSTVINYNHGTIRYAGSEGATVRVLPYYGLEIAASGGAVLAGNVTSTGPFKNLSGSMLNVGNSIFTALGSSFINLGTLNSGMSGVIKHPAELVAFTAADGSTLAAATSTESFYVTVSDGNRNLDGTSAEVFAISLTTNVAAGEDTMTLDLTETGLATGVFKSAAIPVAEGVVVVEDGTIQIAAPGTMTVSYVDSNDASDSDSHTIDLVAAPAEEEDAPAASPTPVPYGNSVPSAIAPVVATSTQDVYPTALGGEALDDSSIRWSFRSGTASASGYLIIDTSSGRIVASSTASSLDFLDEKNLAQLTSYCNRAIQSFTAAGASPLQAYSNFPCVTTLAKPANLKREALSWRWFGRDLVVGLDDQTAAGEYGFRLMDKGEWLAPAFTAAPNGVYSPSVPSFFQSLKAWSREFSFKGLDYRTAPKFQLMLKTASGTQEIFNFETPRPTIKPTFQTELIMVSRTLKTLPRVSR